MDNNTVNDNVDPILIEEHSNDTLLTTFTDEEYPLEDVELEVKKMPSQIKQNLAHKFNNIIFAKKEKAVELDLNEKDINKFTSQSLIDAIAELSIDPPDFQLESNISLENKVLTRLESLGKYAELQSAFIHTVSKSLVCKLMKLVNSYIDTNNKQLLEIEEHVKKHATLEKEISTEQHKNQKLADDISNLEQQLQLHGMQKNEYSTATEKLEQKILDLHNLLKDEKKARAQLEETNTQILEALANEKEKCEKLTEEKGLACEQARQAIIRARQVMNHFFNSTLDDTEPVNLATNLSKI